MSAPVTSESEFPARIGITLGDPRGIGPEITAAVLREPRADARFLVIGPEGVGLSERADFVSVGRWNPSSGGAREAGTLSGRAIEKGIELALDGQIDGLVTGPISKGALAAAGYPYAGHTEFLRDRTGVSDVTMMMTAERTPLGGPLRMALLTAHIALREVAPCLTPELVVRRTRIALAALRSWWRISTPRVAFAGLNPHASEGGLFGDEEKRVLQPAAESVASGGEVEVTGIFPADTVFRRCIEGRADLIVVPYHDVGLAVLKTLARESGVNVTAGLPFPRTSPDHGTAFDIAGQGKADASAMAEAIELCVRFSQASSAGTAR